MPPHDDGWGPLPPERVAPGAGEGLGTGREPAPREAESNRQAGVAQETAQEPDVVWLHRRRHLQEDYLLLAYLRHRREELTSAERVALLSAELQHRHHKPLSGRACLLLAEIVLALGPELEGAA